MGYYEFMRQPIPGLDFLPTELIVWHDRYLHIYLRQYELSLPPPLDEEFVLWWETIGYDLYLNTPDIDGPDHIFHPYSWSQISKRAEAAFLECPVFERLCTELENICGIGQIRRSYLTKEPGTTINHLWRWPLNLYNLWVTPEFILSSRRSKKGGSKYGSIFRNRDIRALRDWSAKWLDLEKFNQAYITHKRMAKTQPSPTYDKLLTRFN